jgi:threonine synthase
MRYVSTRGGESVSLEQAIMAGTAPDGGLFIPTALPQQNMADFPLDASLAEFAAQWLAPFFAGSTLEHELIEICADALNFPAPLRELPTEHGRLSLLELFHGPTAAFKDFGARFLAATMSRIIARRNQDAPATIIVATSGDTGAAVAAAFHRRPGTRVVVLFPDGRVSPRQQHQLTCWGDNVISLAVKGEFDDCQRLAKTLFADPELVARFNLCSANSINVGRLLPQSVYYAHTSLAEYAAHATPTNFIVPTGNLGNAFACAWTKQMGFPIGDLILATNANRTIPDYLDSGDWQPRSSVATLASAMDVGDPSNMERLRNLWGEADSLRSYVRADAVTDAQIREQIRQEYQRSGVVVCPHTATGLHVYRGLAASLRQDRHWIIAATAHPAKFDTIVEPLIGAEVPVPEELARLLALPSSFDTIAPEANEIVSRL